jgi:hypothetical protein
MNSNKKYKDIFDHLKILFKTEIIEFLDHLKKTNRGRKRRIDWDQFFACLFFISDNGMKMYYIKDYFHIAKSTYYYYFDLITKHGFLEKFYVNIMIQYSHIVPIEYLITDTFTVKSMDGSIGVGRNCTDRGRNGIKVSLICDQNLATYGVYLEPANSHDSKILMPTIQSSVVDLKGYRCLADSGYAGKKYISNILKMSGVNLLSKPKRTTNKLLMSHFVSESDLLMINKKRNGIERLNGNVRNFRGLMIKYTKKVSSYLTYLYVALICISCYMFLRTIQHT